MKYQYTPQGVCSRLMEIEIDDNGTVVSANVIGGCHGNLQGICRLIEGRSAKECSERMRGICCGNKGTSCPDQMSKAIDQILTQK